MRLLLDDRSKTNNFQKRLLYFRPKLAANQGSSAGTVLDPILDHIVKCTKLDCSECSILNSVMKTSACPYTEVPEVSGLAGGVELFCVFRGGGKILNLDFKF